MVFKKGNVPWNIGKEHTEESKRKMSESKKGNKNGLGNKNWLGKKHTEESKRKMSESKKGRKHLEETREKIRESTSGSRNHFYGKQHTVETKNKISLANKGKKGFNHSKETKKKISEGNKGKEVSKRTRRKLSEINSGRKHPFYGKSHLIETKRKMRLATLKRIEENHGIAIPNIGRNEKQILDELELCLGHKIHRSYRLKKLGYWLDGYVKELNLAIEVDEGYHFDIDGNISEKNFQRQKEIEQELGCVFFRIDEQEYLTGKN